MFRTVIGLRNSSILKKSTDISSDSMNIVFPFSNTFVKVFQLLLISTNEFSHYYQFAIICYASKLHKHIYEFIASFTNGQSHSIDCCFFKSIWVNIVNYLIQIFKARGWIMTKDAFYVI